jgi:hypothetical protein
MSVQEFKIKKEGNYFVAYDTVDKKRSYGKINIKKGNFFGDTRCMIALHNHLDGYNQENTNTIKVIEYADYSSDENLFYQHKGDVVCLHDDLKEGSSELGWFKVWFDAEMEDREYITVNDTVIYLDSIDEL